MAVLELLNSAGGWIFQLVCYVPYGGGGDVSGTIPGLFGLTKIWLDIPASLLATHTLDTFSPAFFWATILMNGSFSLYDRGE